MLSVPRDVHLRERIDLAFGIATAHLDTSLDRLLDGILFYIPAEILIVVVVLLVALLLLLYISDRLPSESSAAVRVDEPSEPTTRPYGTEKDKR